RYSGEEDQRRGPLADDGQAGGVQRPYRRIPGNDPMKRSALSALFVVIAFGARAQDRTLSWKSLDVTAHIDADGTLHTTERHTMIFDGAWNGGERSFRVGPGQQIQPIELRKIDPTTGHAQPLRFGSNLSEVGEYKWFGDTLRWRTRLPSD